MTLRQAVPADAESLIPILTQLGYPRAPEEIAQRIQHLAAKGKTAIIIAIEDQKPVGLAEVHESDTLISGIRAELGALVVADGHRRKGIGEQLVNAAIEWAEDNGHNKLRVGTNVIRHDAHAFYEKLGFTLEKQHRLYEKLL
ncbi:MAG TPA: GNAT family N-acetyltransferase [Fimbriimonadaceae bacterium]|jgi:GNAT superfamily N-acetyltransferase